MTVMRTTLGNMRLSRPILISSVILGIVWLSGFILLASSNTLYNPVDAGRSILDHLRPSAQSYTEASPTKQDLYDFMCSSLPDHAADLRRFDDKWGKVALEMSIAHRGSGIRMRRALRRLVAGEPFKIVAIGGSITAGHGINRTIGGLPYTTHMTNMLQKWYPNVTVINTGFAGQGSEYFSSCYQLHAPTDADLYIVESAVNDLENANKVEKLGEKHDTAMYTEILVRQLLSNRPDNAVMMLSSFGSDKPFVNAAHLHNVVSEYYDIPRLSMRIFMYPFMLQFPDERISRFDSPDIRHPNELGHEYMGDILVRYLLRESCRAAEEAEQAIVPRPVSEYVAEVEQPELSHASYNPANVKEEDKPWLPYPGVSGSALNHHWDPFTLPSLRLNQHWLRDKPLPEGTSFCKSTGVLGSDGLPTMRPSVNSGWEHYEHRGKHWWKGTTPGATITFDDIEVHAGIVGLFHMRCDQNYGNARCWVDNAKNTAVEVVSRWDFVCISSLHIIAERVPPGKHTVTCEILDKTDDKNGKHDFAISAIVTH